MNRTSTYKTTNGEGFCCEPQTQSRNLRSIPTQNVDYEKLQYYYHSDHLGSASYITNLDGEVVQHIEYVPFGEVFIEERNNTWNTPYLFNGKELDEETGLYYYGARYYNPRISLWYGVDPLFDKYPAHSPYCYTMNNPVVLVDPDGEDTYLVIYGAGWVNPNMKGKRYDVGDGFKQSALQLQENIRNSGVLQEGDDVVVVYAPNEEMYLEAVNKNYDSGKIKQLDVFSHGSSNSLNLGGDEGGSADYDYRLLSAYASPGYSKENELRKIDSENFTDDANVTLWGCNLGTNNHSSTGKKLPSHAQKLATHLGKNRQVQAFDGGGGAEFKTKDGQIVYDGTLIRSADRTTQEVKLSTYKKED